MAPGRRVVDVSREALLLVSMALDGMGAPFAVQAFSGEGPQGVVVRNVKRFDQPVRRQHQLRGHAAQYLVARLHPSLALAVARAHQRIERAEYANQQQCQLTRLGAGRDDRRIRPVARDRRGADTEDLRQFAPRQMQHVGRPQGGLGQHDGWVGLRLALRDAHVISPWQSHEKNGCRVLEAWP